MTRRADPRTRSEAARSARRLLSKEIDFDQFLREFPEEDLDDDIDDLLGQLEHEPKVGGLFGVSEETHRVHMRRTWKLLELLEGADRTSVSRDSGSSPE